MCIRDRLHHVLLVIIFVLGEIYGRGDLALCEDLVIGLQLAMYGWLVLIHYWNKICFIHGDIKMAIPHGDVIQTAFRTRVLVATIFSKKIKYEISFPPLSR